MNTTYTFAAHLPSLVERLSATESTQKRLFALVDAGQLTNLRRPVPQLVPQGNSRLLFQGCAAESALALSPVLCELSDNPTEQTEQILALDGICRHLPVLSLLHSTLTLDALTKHLQSLLFIQADGTDYLLRLADSQMLNAVLAALTPGQQTQFFEGIEAWWVVDHQGRMHDTAPSQRIQPPAPLELNAAQTQTLLDAAQPGMLASQLRHLEHTFGQQLSHAQQMRFVDACLSKAEEAGIADETEQLIQAQHCWRTKGAVILETGAPPPCSPDTL